MIQPPIRTDIMDPPDSTAASSVAASGGGIDLVKLKQYLHVVIRRIWIVAICFAGAMVISVINISKQEAVFQASTSLLLSQGTTLPGQGPRADFNVFGDFLDTQVRIIYSRSVLAKARELLNISDQEAGRLLRSISVWPIGRSAVISITVQSLDPQFSADYANAIADAYIEFKAEDRMSGAQTTIINLSQQANRIREELRKAEDAMILFKKDHSYVVAQGEGNIAAGMMANVARRAASHKLERMILEIQRPLLSDASDDVILTALSSRYLPPAMAASMSSSDVMAAQPPPLAPGASMLDVTSPLGIVDFSSLDASEWLRLKRQKSLLEHELLLARENLRDSHPGIRRLVADLKKTDDAIRREVQFATQKYYAELEALSLKESALARVESLWLGEAVETELLSDRFNTLRNDVDRMKRLLDAVLARIRDVDISSGIIPDNVTVMERATRRDSPITPRKIQSVFLAGLIGIAIGVGIVFGLDFLDDSIRYPEEVSKMLGLRFLGIIPSASWSVSDIRTHLLSQIDPKSGLAEAYRNIRATLLLDAQRKGTKSILLTSSLPREGKTTTSLNLAISFAQAGLRVLIVDADLRRGEIHKYFGLEGGRGLADVLGGQAKPESVVQRTSVANLDMVATGPFPVNPAELMLRQEFRAFMEYAKRAYDRIIFDGPPVMAVSEAGVLASLVDSTVMVVWAGKTSRKVCQLTIQNLLQRGARIDGCILNNLEFGRVGYYYYSTYYGYYTYDYRYDDATSPKA